MSSHTSPALTILATRAEPDGWLSFDEGWSTLLEEHLNTRGMMLGLICYRSGAIASVDDSFQSCLEGFDPAEVGFEPWAKAEANKRTKHVAGRAEAQHESQPHFLRTADL